jgi:hypothetical protein
VLNKSPGTIFHPTNRNTSPTPRDIHNVNLDFPNTPEEFDDFFDQTTNRNRSNYRIYMKATMSHNEKELQQRMFNYLRYNRIYLNSPFIDDNTLEMVGFIENGHSRLLYRPIIEMKIKKGLKEVIEGKILSPTQKAQLKNLSNPIRVVCYSGTFQAGANDNPVICDGIILKSAKSQSKIVMELLAMLPDDILGEQYNIIPKSLNALLGYETYGKIVEDTVNYTANLTPITIMNCHPSVFEDKYDNIKSNGSTTIEVRKFIKNCGVISIENTSETEKSGKYILVVQKNKLENTRNAIGKMFQEFQQQSGRTAAMACLEAYQMYPLVNDNVTISGHAEMMAAKYRDKYKNKSATKNKNTSYTQPYDFHGRTAENSPNIEQTTATHIPTSILNSQRNHTGTKTPTPNTTKTYQQNNPRRKQQQAGTRLFSSNTTTPTTQQADTLTIGTAMSGLSPDDSAKTMMTNMSKMVESIGTVVTTLAKENAETNDTMKQMMVQQAATMNNLMAMMCRNEERRYGGETSRVPQNICPTATQTNSTITNSQQSTTQNQSPLKRNRVEQQGDETVTTVATEVQNQQENEREREETSDDMIEDDYDEIETHIENEQNERNNQEEVKEVEDEMMMDNEATSTEQTTATTTKTVNTEQITTPIAEGNFDHQFNSTKHDKHSSDPVQNINPGGSQQ